MKVILVILTAGLAAAQTPTVSDARAFLERVNRVQKSNGTDGSRATWIAETYITDDSQSVRSVIAARNAAQTRQFIGESHQFDGLALPPDLERQMLLLRRNAPAVPADPELALETTQTVAQLSGMYGRGKYCDSGKCIGIDELEVLMAKSRDPEELLKLWTGWHTIGAPMREKYARFVELSNTAPANSGTPIRAPSGVRGMTSHQNSSRMSWNAHGSSSNRCIASCTRTSAPVWSRNTALRRGGRMG